MRKSLRVLNIEDSEHDAALLTRHLSSAGYDLVSDRVETAAGLQAALESRDWDVILCDYSMPNFNALAALDVLRMSGNDIPLIIISGTVGEDVAVEAMLTGANDYLSKDNLTRLVPAIERELQDADNRRKQLVAEQALQASEGELRALFAAMDDVILVLDRDGHHLKVAPTTPPHFYKRGVYRIGKTVHEIFPVGVADFILGTIRQCLDEARTLNVQYTLLMDGGELWFDGTVTPMTDDSVIWVARDITERKRAENERAVIFNIIQGIVHTPGLDEFLKLVHHSISEIIYAENCYVMLHDPISEMDHFEFWADKYDPVPEPHSAGRGFGNYVQRTGTPLLLTEDAKQAIIAAGEAEQIGSVSPSWLGVPLRTPSGTIGVMVLQHYEKKDAYSDGDLEFLASVGDQIALVIERKRAEDALGESEERYRDLIENAIDIIYTHDLDGNYTSVNNAGERITGYTRSESLTMNLAELVAPEYREKAAIMQAAKLAGEDIAPYDIEVIAKDGHRVVVEINTRVIYKNGVPISIQGIARDITERHVSAVALEASEASFRSLFDTANDAIVVVAEGIFITCNPAAEELFGCTLEDLIGHSPDEFSPHQQPDGSISSDKAQAFMEAAINIGPQFFEWQHQRADGTLFDAEVSLNRVEYGGAAQLQGTVRDITERKQAGQALRESENRLRTIIDTEPECLKLMTADGRVIEMNPAGLRMVEADSLADVENMCLFDLVADAQRPAFEALTKRVFLGESGILEFQMTGLKGTERWLVTHASPLRDASGQITALLGIARDITEAKKVEDALIESNEKFHQLADNITDAFWIRSLDMVHVYYVSPAFEKIWNRSVEILYTNPELWQEFVVPDDRERVTAAFDTLTDGAEKLDIEYRISRPDGEVRWVRVRAFQVRDAAGTPIRYAGIVTDITDRKQDAHSLQESETRYRTLFETSPDGVAMFDLEMNVIVSNERSAEIFGYQDVASMSGTNAFDLIAADYQERARGNIQRMFETGTLAPIESMGVKADGSQFAVEFSAMLIRDPAGNPTGILGVTRDITERKQAAESIRESEERFAGAFEYAPIGVALVAPDGRWLKVNRALCEMVGYTEAELLASSSQTITHPDDLEVDLANMKAMVEGRINSYQMEKRYIHKNSQLVMVLLNVSLVRDRQGQPRYFISQIQDMTERKHLEEQLRQSQKMEAIGVLAGGVAHDFNNLLTAICGYSDMTLKKMAPDDLLRDYLEEIKKAGERATVLTGQLLAFSRKQVLKPRVYDLNAAITDLEKMLRRIVRENIEFRTVLDPGLSNIKADPGQIEQVIMNLVVNARDAMAGGGTLTIETQNIYLDQEYVSHHLAVHPGEFVRLTVTDTGAGMTAETLEHIFEPFFTTKEIGKGTGLGLSTVYGIVKQSGGDIMVYSEIDHGTSFKIYLPCVVDNVEKPRWPGKIKGKYLGTETILLAEDDDVVRHLVLSILTDNGYRVLEAAGGQAAITICKTRSEPIHMLLTDVTMTGMNGRELKDQVVKLLPDIKVLFMSGYTDDALAHRGHFDTESEFIEKPFTPDGLARKVREVFEYEPADLRLPG